MPDKRLSTKPRVSMLGADIDVLNVSETIELVEQYIIQKEPLHLVGVNADKINEMRENERLRSIVNGCGVINADGASVVMASKFLKKPLPERVAGIDLMQDLIQLSEQKGYKVFLLGAKQEVVEKTAQTLQDKHPGLILTGIHNGYFSEKEWPEISDILRAAETDFVFVGITSPMKEYLVEYLQKEGHRCVFMGVGGSFDVISGNIPRAPLWMQKSNLEWLFRVIQEPRRLFKRYFVGNWKFIMAVLREKRST